MTSPQHFVTSLNAILVALFNLVLLGLAVDLDEVMRHADNIIYAFRTLCQRIQQRKYPANLEELWPYIGVPLQAVSDDLGVTINLLQERIFENGMLFWPAPFNNAYILLGLQYTRVINATNMALFSQIYSGMKSLNKKKFCTRSDYMRQVVRGRLIFDVDIDVWVVDLNIDLSYSISNMMSGRSTWRKIAGVDRDLSYCEGVVECF
uniref:Uncharacterized protein n=1 Tax=Tanacetum cinerariifolium TaxID=118510 RepID=A0A699IHU9_TANCI|nr:hypothetical protein [Tanacetum cinerariifolium]